MKLQTCDSAAEFLEAAKPVLEECPATHHHLVQIGMLLENGSDFFDGPYGFWVIFDNQQPVSCALHALPDGLVLSEIDSVGIKTLWPGLKHSGIIPSRIVCGPDVSDSVTRTHEDVFGAQLMHQRTWHVGRLDRIQKTEGTPAARLRLGTSIDYNLVNRWASQYREEQPAFLDVVSFINMKLRDRHLYILEDDSPKAMVTVSGLTNTGARISSVYTPPPHRGKGYASRAVAEMGAQLIEKGSRFVVLTWGKDDKIGNVYQRMGFRKVGTRESWIPQKNDDVVS